MSQFNRFGGPRTNVLKETASGETYVDWKDVESLRRMLSPNGKIYSRKRLSTTAAEQRKVAQAIKRARHMGLLPFTSATL
ncbi:MAG: 30S ribosomal protein S18 [Phycisphaerales bacterium]|jgi:small subunit ribosomal protein S18|nr:30S ribosomal protein S18 [bacterium]